MKQQESSGNDGPWLCIISEVQQMRRHSTILASFIAMCSASAFAADMPIYKSPPAPVYIPPQGPSGFHILGGVGGGFSPGQGTYGKFFKCNDIDPACASGVTPSVDRGSARNEWLGSLTAQLGYTARLSSLLMGGVVVDATALSLSKNRTVRTTETPSDPALLPTIVNLQSNRMRAPWLATARLRLGVQATPRVMLFGSGGVALVSVRTSTFKSLTEEIPGTQPLVTNWEGRGIGIRLGYALGGGLEYSLTQNFALSFEYLYFFARQNHVVSLLPGGRPAELTSFKVRTPVHGNIFRIGLMYRL